MTEYTPTTEQVRDAYVRGMRDTFIASAGDHCNEFDRWFSAQQDRSARCITQAKQDELDEKFNENLVRGRIPKEEHAAVWDLAVKAVLDVLGVQA